MLESRGILVPFLVSAQPQPLGGGRRGGGGEKSVGKQALVPKKVALRIYTRMPDLSSTLQTALAENPVMSVSLSMPTR